MSWFATFLTVALLLAVAYTATLPTLPADPNDGGAAEGE